MRNLGIILVAVGVLGLIYGGINYNRGRTVIEMGDVSVTATERSSIPVPVIVGALVLIGGVALVVGDKRRVR